MLQTFKIKRVTLSNDVITECIISYLKGEDIVSINISDPEFGDYKFTGTDLFNALENIREFLEGRGCLLLCAGSMPNVYPSRMSRQMSNGRKSYIHNNYVKPSKIDIIDIFTPVKKELVGTLSEQNKFMLNWNKYFEDIDNDKK